jgi:hypothetical protein
MLDILYWYFFIFAKQLVEVNIDGNQIGDEGGDFLLQALQDAVHLRKLVVTAFMKVPNYTRFCCSFCFL